MLHQQRQRFHHQAGRPKALPELGASTYPIIVPPYAQGPENAWNIPDSTAALESFAWPSVWFDVPSITPPSAGQLSGPQFFDMSDPLPELICTFLSPSLRFQSNLIHFFYETFLDSDVKTPETSPASLHDTCTTPPQESANVVAVCNAPLFAPRPLPCTPPAFLQFDCLPEEDEDLSFPPYTHSRRHACDTQQKQAQGSQSHLSQHANNPLAQNPRKRPAPPLPNVSEADGITLAQVPSISKKRRRVMHGAESGLLALTQPAASVFVDSSENFFEPQLMNCDMNMNMDFALTREDMMGMGWR